MVEIDCHRCGEHIEENEYWVHLSVFHHDRPGNPRKWSRDDPKNDSMNLCETCYDEIKDELCNYDRT